MKKHSDEKSLARVTLSLSCVCVPLMSHKHKDMRKRRHVSIISLRHCGVDASHFFHFAVGCALSGDILSASLYSILDKAIISIISEWLKCFVLCTVERAIAEYTE